MNKLEKKIFRGALKAHRIYGKMTGGLWLWRGPESILQMQIALLLHGDYYVDVETSPRKINEDKDKKPRGRPPKNKNHRFDVIVWKKSSQRIRAIVEIKRTSKTGALKPDAAKLRKYRAGAASDEFDGYLLVYSEAKRGATLDHRIVQAAIATRARVIDKHVSQLSEEWQWSMALLRLK